MTPTSALIGPNRAFELADGELKAISSRLPTMYDECYVPAGPNRDRPTPHRDPTAGPDDVKGSKWDCGLADERAREAWVELVAHLERAEQQATNILRALPGWDAAPVPVCRPASLLDAQLRVQRLRRLLWALRGFYETYAGTAPTAPKDGGVAVDSYGVDPERARWLLAQLGYKDDKKPGFCFSEITYAKYKAQGIVREVGNGRPPDVCPGCRRTGSVGQPRKGGLCYACDKRNQRNPLASARVRRTTVKAWRRAKAS